MKQWAIVSTVAVALLWLVSLTRHDAEEGPPAAPPIVQAPPAEPFNPLEDWDKVKLADLLDKPRAELAALCLEKEQQILGKEQMRTEGKLKFILPVSRFPIAYPIWRQARYSAKKGMILPPYLDEDAHDSILALHLARFGDVEGARKLADPSDTATVKEIERLALSRNYPAEWTRLVALYLHEAHFSLAAGNNDGARRIVAFHRQLAALLGADASRSPLGNALLARGKLLLDQAMLAWTNVERTTPDMYQLLVDDALAEWGEISGPTLPPVSTADKLAAWLGGKSQGLLVTSGNPLRALDVLGLALPDQALQGVVGLCRPDGSLEEIDVVYGPDQQDVHESRDISYWLDEQLAMTTRSAADYQAQTSFTFPSLNVGAVVRIVPKPAKASTEDAAAQTVKLPRDFGSVNLNRTFEQNRRLFAWTQGGTRLAVNDARSLADLKPPFAGQTITQAVLIRDGKNDLVGELRMTLAHETGKRINLIDLAGPIWEKLGAAAVNLTGDTRKIDSVELTWKDAETTLCLRVPNQEDLPATLEVGQVAPTDAARRLESAQLFDASERKERWSQLKTDRRLMRARELFELGMSRADLAKRMTRVQALRQEISGGDLYTIVSARDDGTSDWALRQAVARFDTTGRLVEARLRFCDLPGRKPGSVLKLVDEIRKNSGAPQIVDQEGGDPKNAAKVWRWLDDTTLLQTCADPSGVELILKDCPLEHPQGRPLPPLWWLPRGPAHCLLGTTREALFKHWNVKTPTVIGDAIYLRPDDGSPFDGLLVWLDGERVSRVVARHKNGGEFLPTPAAAGKAVAEAWGRQAQVLGWPWQQQNARQGHVLAWGNIDDCTQVRIFWQESENSLRVFTEWK